MRYESALAELPRKIEKIPLRVLPPCEERFSSSLGKKYARYIKFLPDRGCSMSVTINIGDVFDIQFVLNDDRQSIIREEVTIRRTNGHFVGAEFSHQDKYKYELDFYISDHGGAFE